MIELEPVIRTDLEWAVPLPPAELADWDDVLVRADLRSHSGRSRLAVLLAAVVAAVSVCAVVTPLGGAIVQGVGDFSSWLRGEPGEPASPSEQEAFDEANSRSWAGFPPDTELRRLISTSVGGHEVDLFGFRSVDSLCLRIVGRGLNGSPALSCAPVDALKRASAPVVVVVQADHAMGLASHVSPSGGPVAPQAQATFGIVADGVEAVELVADDGTHRATVSANAFLYVAERPKVGTRVRKVFAIDAQGRRTEVPFASAPFGTWDQPVPTHNRPTGPSRVEREVEGGEIGWVLRHEDRGEAPPDDARYLQVGMLRGYEFARLVAPDPRSDLRVLVAIGHMPELAAHAGELSLCAFVVSGGGSGGGCNLLADPFPNAPFWLGESIAEGGDQYATLSGLASDDVARLELFLATGESQPIPLRDNAWAIRAARANRPYRVVAYDREGRIIGIQDMGDTEAHLPRPAGAWRTLFTARDSQGRVGEVRVAPSSDGGQCHEIRLPGGASSSGCTPAHVEAGTPKLLLGINATPDSAWVTGEVAPDVDTVELVFDDGRTKTVRPTDGLVLVPLPAGATAEKSGVTRIVGRDASGRQVAVLRPGRAP